MRLLWSFLLVKLGVAVPECKEDHSLLQDHRPRRAIYEAWLVGLDLGLNQTEDQNLLSLN